MPNPIFIRAITDDEMQLLRGLSRAGEHGRGMHIVSALSVAWGTEPLDDGGKVVWAELPLRP